MIERRLPLLLRLKLLLRDVHPAVWRRVKLADSLSIADLHRVIQLLMGWDDDHLHRFRIHGRDYGITYVGGPSFDEDAAAVRLAQFGFRPTERFLYEYDFTAGWQVEVLNRCRRLAKDWENLNRKARAFLLMASIRLMVRRLCRV